MARSDAVVRTTERVQLLPLNPNLQLWQVMPSTLKLETFLDGGLWFARLDQFGDPNDTFEGALPATNLGLLHAKLPGAQLVDVQNQYALGIQLAYASCWHINDDKPSDEVWNEFADGNGIAIRTDGKTLQSQLDSISGDDGPVYIAPVKYINHNTDFVQDGNIIAATFAIRDDYSKEQEFRALIYTHGTAANNHLLKKKGPYGPLVSNTTQNGIHELKGYHHNGKAIVVSIDPGEFIKEILIQPGAGCLTRHRLKDLLSQHGLEDRLQN